MDYRQITFPTIFPRIYGVNYYSQGFIDNLTIKNLYPQNLRASVLSVGEKIYNDSTWLITKCDLDFNRVSLIRTDFQKRLSTSTNEISFFVNEPSIIYVAYDEKDSSNIPNWLMYKFKRTTRIIKSNQGKQFQLYELKVRKGQITLEGNSVGVQNPGFNYFVLIENQKNQNIIVTRNIIDNQIDEIRFTSDYMLQTFKQGILSRNIWLDPLHNLYITDQNQFVQNGLSVLEVYCNNFLEQINELNEGILPFEPLIENFIPQDRQPKYDETYLSFTPQEPLTSPNILITGTNFINNKTTLGWVAENANRVLLNNMPVDFKGFLDIQPNQTTYYVFQVEADTEVIVKNYNVQVKNEFISVPVDLPYLVLKANKKIVNKDELVTIEWDATNYTQLFLGDVELNSSSGSITQVINTDSDFVLNAKNPYMDVKVNLLIRVNEI